MCWVRSKDGYKETKERVPLSLRKAIPAPFPSEDKGGHARLEQNRVLQEAGGGEAGHCSG